MKRNVRISTRIFVLAIICSLVCLVSFVAIAYATDHKLEVAFAFLATFVCFIAVLLTMYFFYYVDISNKVKGLTEKIRVRFANNEIPQKRDQLEEEDGLAMLEERVDFLIELREKEVVHFENLDSYRKEYLGNVSHELKTPVFNIQGYLDTLIHGGIHDEAINLEYLQRAEKSVDRLINIIDDLETITQLESGVLELDVDTFDIANLCREIFAGLEMQASKRGIRLELLRKYDKPVLVVADKFRIRQVLVNLITNSIKYGNDNGITTVGFSYLDNDVIVTVSDNGYGIDEKHLPRVFERFYRVDKGRSREQGGTGLGLSIVKHIIEAHQKSIKVESEAGKGTTFTFSLPAEAQ